MVERRSPKPNVVGSNPACPDFFLLEYVDLCGLRNETMKKIINFIKECVAELKRVNWPTKDDVVAQTVVVIVSLVIVSAVLAVMDFVSLEAVTKLITLGM